jgi:transcription termination factor Rho
MYTKQELEAMDIPLLMDIANKLGVKVTPNDELEEVIYAILDKAAVDAASTAAPAKKKRTRIVKKDTNKVYTVNGKEGENFDVKAGKKKKAAKPAPLFNNITFENGEEENVESNVADEADVVDSQEPLNTISDNDTVETVINEPEISSETESDTIIDEIIDTQMPEDEVISENDIIPEAEETNYDNDSAPNLEMLEMLQEKMSQHNKSNANLEFTDQIWEGDPGDGTDFITVVDLPIEDFNAIPNLDIFDRPTAPKQDFDYHYTDVAPIQKAVYDFNDIIEGNGVLEILTDGYGFLRSSDYNYLSSPDDIYISPQQIKKYGLKTGDVIDCTVRPPHENEKYFSLSNIKFINGRIPSDVRDRVAFEHLTPLFPDEKFNLCGDKATTNPSVRIVDLFSPIGKGQRALIVAQPKTGKTILMKDIANAIAANHPDAYIMMLLIDERPEEVTDMARTVNAEVIASTFDEPAERHVKIAGIVLEKAKRMVECGHNVVIFLDSITRLARAYNTVAPASGKVLTGGVDSNALQKPKRFFGAARNIEGGGSLTIIATALVDTGSKMDEVIFEEFKGTGNSEIQLNRSLANKRIFPAIDLVQSSTRRDDLLQDPNTISKMWICRKFIAEMNPIEAMNTIRDTLVQTRNNEEFLMAMNG